MGRLPRWRPSGGPRLRRDWRPYWPLVALCTVGVALRALVTATYSSAVFVYVNGDSIRYARIPYQGYQPPLFSDNVAPAGYPAFLKVLRAIWSAMPFTVGVQHLLGVPIALLLYAAARRAGASRGFALVPSVVVLLSGDQLFLEHALLSEIFWALLVALGLYALLRGVRDDGINLPWLLLGGGLVGASYVVRQVSSILVVVALVWVVLAVRQSILRRLGAALAVAVAALAIVGAYVGVAHLKHGRTGLGGDTGFQLYGRVAPFANCADFKPPGRTRLLCQTVPPSRRPGPSAYLFGPGSPLRARFHYDWSPQDNNLLLHFALDAIENQPGDYLAAVVDDWEEAAGVRPERFGEGTAAADMSFSLGKPFGAPAGVHTVQQVAAIYRRAYTSIRARPLRGWGQRLGSYQSIIRLHEWLVIPLLLIALGGLLASRRPQRRGIALILGFSLALYMFPAVVALWSFRYGIFAGELLVTAAAAGGWQLLVRARRARAGGHAPSAPIATQLEEPTRPQAALRS